MCGWNFKGDHGWLVECAHSICFTCIASDEHLTGSGADPDSDLIEDSDEATKVSSWCTYSASFDPQQAAYICTCGMAEASGSAQRRWELENNVQVDEEVEGFFRYNHAEQQAVQQQKPWSKDPHLYKQ